MSEQVSDLLERCALLQPACRTSVPQGPWTSCSALYASCLQSSARQRPQSLCSYGAIGRLERYEQVPAGAARSAPFEVLQDGVTNLTLERIALWPPRFE